MTYELLLSGVITKTFAHSIAFVDCFSAIMFIFEVVLLRLINYFVLVYKCGLKWRFVDILSFYFLINTSLQNICISFKIILYKYACNDKVNTD